LVTDEEYNSTSTEPPVHELSLVAFPAVILRIVDQITPNKQAKGICHFSSITLNMTIWHGIQNARLRFQQGKKLVFARDSISLGVNPCKYPVKVKKIG
jgi:hypothetical protein